MPFFSVSPFASLDTLPLLLFLLSSFDRKLWGEEEEEEWMGEGEGGKKWNPEQREPWLA